jgi:hypothetical protein
VLHLDWTTATWIIQLWTAKQCKVADRGLDVRRRSEVGISRSALHRIWLAAALLAPDPMWPAMTIDQLADSLSRLAKSSVSSGGEYADAFVSMVARSLGQLDTQFACSTPDMFLRFRFAWQSPFH